MATSTIQAYMMSSGTPFYAVAGGLRAALTAYGDQPLAIYFSSAKSTICNTLRDGLRVGRLTVQDGEETHEFGGRLGNQNRDEICATIRVLSSTFWIRIYFDHDLGLAEAYMFKDFETSNLKGIMNLWLENRDNLQGLQSYYKSLWIIGSALWVRLFGHSLERSKFHAIIGYDCSNAFFEAILSSEMTYSSAIWPDSTGGVKGDLETEATPIADDALERAQLNKIHIILQKARVQAGDRLLEFGSGWGAMSIEAAKLGCNVDTITLSIEQKKYAEQRILAEGLQDRITVHLLDYRSLPTVFKGKFDAFVSVEMIEAVGVEYLEKYFAIVDWALKPDKAAAVITASTQPSWRFSKYQATDYSRRYQWPNSHIPSVTSLVTVAERATAGRLVVEATENFAIHYPRTLREWGRRLEKNWNNDMIARLLEDQPQLAKKDNLDIFKRKWQYMFTYAEVGYAKGYTSMHYFTFVRPENVAEKCG